MCSASEDLIELRCQELRDALASGRAKIDAPVRNDTHMRIAAKMEHMKQMAVGLRIDNKYQEGEVMGMLRTFTSLRNLLPFGLCRLSTLSFKR